ncbi:MBL fold metallo-hydrolase [Salinisphaera sp. Q1T1-3]|uniref:MBL fold metallo-hydrolase n=1 Tax=Salinisphaera sp. Q1T1-3 TaxID=2321229 RepID=UPI000E75BE2F|nr:MBL fold metallo-hydrolase [Salinisphaera sp. Q1T1-3]RJS92186.1 MBL fold metallo-hydrolase [Salinisphaera sp. Q1T1-3]
MPSERPEVVGFYHEPTGSVQYVVIDNASARCAIVDPVWDYDPASGRTSTRHADEILAFIERRELGVDWVLDTHPHADHFSAAGYLGRMTGAPRAIGAEVIAVQQLWQAIYNLGDALPADGRQWDRLFADGETFRIGHLTAHVMFSPGHTLASITYRVGDAAFVHDTLFQPDFGTARADFPGADARALYDTIQRILALPDETRLFTGHDYRPGGRAPAWESSVAAQRAHNPHLQVADAAEYVALRQARDTELPIPDRMLAALQINLRGGQRPPAEDNGSTYLKIPLDRF